MGGGDKYSVLLPTYNERENLPIITWLLCKYFKERLVFRVVVCVIYFFRRNCLNHFIKMYVCNSLNTSAKLIQADFRWLLINTNIISRKCLLNLHLRSCFCRSLDVSGTSLYGGVLSTQCVSDLLQVISWILYLICHQVFQMVTQPLLFVIHLLPNHS